eukprot:NODE_7437_length_1578_cov_4.572019.p1 GENE.NODE_7437_length_1578_cov_4.572019~~NODE_7437_length_1578_cov_4.572019.p1  ORF type:complete len:307 (+),score=114.32 NODE_7437_length_1578_cov_4.572019:527-1447(+)
MRRKGTATPHEQVEKELRISMHEELLTRHGQKEEKPARRSVHDELLRRHLQQEEVSAEADKEGNVRIIVITGPCGVGKCSLVSRLRAGYPERFGVCTSHTTRPPCECEKDGVDYHFVTKEAFAAGIKDRRFITHRLVDGEHFGTSVEAVQDLARKGQICILLLNVGGAELVKRSLLKAYAEYICISPPSTEELEKRLRSRGTDTEETIVSCLEDARREVLYSIERPGFFDAVVVNDDLETAYAELLDAVFPKVGGSGNLQVPMLQEGTGGGGDAATDDDDDGDISDMSPRHGEDAWESAEEDNNTA